MNNSRTKSSIKNVIVSIILNFVNILVGLIARALFIKILGTEILGVNGLFTNVISMLAIVEMGIGSAIIYNLYKPIANNDIKTIKALMKFYKKSYHIIGGIVAVLGIALIPFLPYIIGNVETNMNLNIVYILFLLDTVLSYFLSYKRSILYADQKNYIIDIIHIVYIILMNFLQLLFLYITKNYYIYLFIKVIMRIIENIVILLVANKIYPYLKERNTEKLSKNIEKDILKKIKALFLHQIGGFVINGTDNIIISRYLGVNVVGLYSNYYLIINAVQTVAKQIITAITPSIGNMLATETTEKQFDIFKKMRFLNFGIATFFGVSIYIVMDSFITIWIGEEYLLSKLVLFILVLNFYQKTSRYTYSSFKEAKGIFYEDRFVPIIEAGLNIVISIILVKFIGLEGVFIGTIISGFVLWCYSYPKFIYKNIFKRSYYNYAKETIGYIVLFLIILGITIGISNLINVEQKMLNLFIKIIISIIIPNIIILLIFRKNANFKYYTNLLKKLYGTVIKRKKE